MKIEILFAIIVGVVLGLLGMFGVVSLLGRPVIPTSISNSPKPHATASDKTVMRPKTNFTWDDTDFLLEGESPQSPFVIFATETSDKIISLTDNHYQVSFTPFIGLGSYKILTPLGNELKKLQILSLSNLPQNEDISVGAITDLTQDGLQLRTEDGVIEQAKFLPNVNVTNIIKDPKKVTTTDLAIGDKIAVVGKKAEKEVIALEYVIILPVDIQATKLSVIHGNIDSFDKSSLSVKESGKEAITLGISQSTKFFGLKSDATVRNRTKLIAKDIGIEVYAVAISSDSAITVRSLFISE